MNVVVEKEDVRLDQYVADSFNISRSKVQKLIKEEKVLVNNKIEKASYLVKLDDVIDVNDSLDFQIHINPENIDLNIVYEDEYLLIVNKESGMVVHPAPGNYSNTLVNALMGKFSLSNSEIRPGIVHRIDKDTSGLLVVAKNDLVHEKLSNMIKDKKVERKYLALVVGVIKHETGTIDAPIGRDPNNRQKMMVTDVNSKDAVTHFRVLKRYNNYTLIECKLETGRTHQIRVHMNYIGYPIYNDPIYGRSKKTTLFGQFLHSTSIKFIHPITEQEIFYQVDVPDEFRSFLDELDNIEK